MSPRFKESDAFLSIAKQHMASIQRVFTDQIYIVEEHEIDGDRPFKCRLVIKRIDKEPIRSWREMQDIKNAIVGEDAVAVEIYPRESEVTDTGNLYHLWVLREGLEIPVVLTPPLF